MKKKISLFVLLLLLYTNCFSQIRIRDISSPLPSEITSYSNTASRKFISLNQNWIFGQKDNEGRGVEVNIPSTYNSDEVMAFQKILNFSDFDIKTNTFRIHFLGISYSSDILLNDVIVYKKAGGNFPFTVELPNDIFNFEGENLLKVIVKKELDPQNSIPLFQRFLFPINSGGIVRDVFLEVLPKENIQFVKYSANIEKDYKAAQLNFTFNVNKESLEEDSKYKIDVSVINKNGHSVSNKTKILDAKQKQISVNLDVSNPQIWFPNTPHQYSCELKLFRNDSLVDVSKRKIIIANLKNGSDNILLNDKAFAIKGVTYIPSSKEHGELHAYSDLKKDLQIIKGMGINSVRFAKATPHPFALEICSEIGLIPFIEIPLNSPPELIADDINFHKRAERFIDEFVKSYSAHSPLLVFGVGSGYLPHSSIHLELIKKLSKIVNANVNNLTFASFNGIPQTPIESLDLYGIELFNDLTNLEANLSNTQISTSKIFISEATYPSYNGSTNGYLNPFSLEAQANFFEHTINTSGSKKLSGFFLNSMFDYYGDFNSLYTKQTEDNLYRIGIVGADRNINRTSYNVIKSKINNSKRVVIPLGSTKDEAPMLFIIIGLVLSVLMGILINSKKKLREDAGRALLRPYNFFADIRDHRIISGFATVILMLILAGSHSLLIINLLYYFRNSIIFEKVLVSFGSPALISTMSFLAWNPNEAFFIIFAMSILFLIGISVLISLASFFIRTKIYFRSIFFTVVWALLPLALLLPIKMVLYRILVANSFNMYVYIFLGIYFLWIARRILNGIYVIFDINAGRAYLYSLLTFVLIFGSFLLYFQIYHSTIYYLINVFNQANLI